MYRYNFDIIFGKGFKIMNVWIKKNMLLYLYIICAGKINSKKFTYERTHWSSTKSFVYTYPVTGNIILESITLFYCDIPTYIYFDRISIMKSSPPHLNPGQFPRTPEAPVSGSMYTWKYNYRCWTIYPYYRANDINASQTILVFIFLSS